MKAKLLLIICPILALLIGCTTPIQPSSFEKTVILTVPTYYHESQKPAWDAVNYNIANTDANIIIVEWAGNGGYSDMGDKTIKAIEKAKKAGKTVIFRLTGEGISMHANVPCHASKIEWGGSWLTFHSGFFGHNKDGSKMYSSDSSYFEYCVAQGPLKGILTSKDIHTIIVDRKRVEVSPTHHTVLPDYP